MPTETSLRLAPGVDPVRLKGAFAEMRIGARGTEAMSADGEIASAVRRAMNAPVGLPPLIQCFTADDQIAVALGAGVPRADAVLRGLIAELAEAEIEPRQVTIVTASAEPTLADKLQDLLDAGLQIVPHDPTDDENLCFAGVDERDEPLRISRPLFEADVLLPVTCAHTPGHPASHGAFGDLYPAFGDAAAIRRLGSGRSQHDHTTDADRAGWVLGVIITLQVVPGEAGGVASVFAGEAQQVDRESARASEQLWTAVASEPASLVIVTLGDEPERQTWQSLATLLDSAERLATPDAAVVVVTQLSSSPPEALIAIAAEDDVDHALHRLQSKKDADLPLARSVAAALDRGPLYLMSGLDADDVESLGMAPLASVDELQHLVASRPSVLVITDAEHAVATLAEEAIEA